MTGIIEQGVGASVPDQELAVPVEPVARLDPAGFDPSRSLLRSLARECVRLLGPNREMDLSIAIAVNFDNAFHDAATGPDGQWQWNAGGDEVEFIRDDNGKRYGFLDPQQFVPRWTRSIDVARTLVPDGWSWTLHSHGCAQVFEEDTWFDGEGASPAIALCVASLRALATQDKEK